MKKPMMTMMLLAVLLLPGTAPARTDGIERAVRSLEGVEAQFTQSFTPRGFKKAQVEKGNVIFGSPPRMRWTYESPERKVFIFDGTMSWFYLPDDKQVTINRLTDDDRASLPFLVLSDGGRIEQSYKVEERQSRGVITTKLVARSAAVAIPEIVLTRAASDQVLRRLEYSDRQGNRTVFELSGHRRTKAGAELFRFTPPPGTQITGG